MYRNEENKRLLLITILLIIVSVLALLSDVTTIPGTQIFKDSIANIQYYLIEAPIEYVQSIGNELISLKDTYKENEILRQSIDSYAKEIAENDVLKDDLEELRKLMNMKDLSTSYKLKYTSIIQRDMDSWNSEVIIDAGKQSGIKEGMSVVTSKGMIGIVTKVTSLSSTVQLLTQENTKSQLPVMIKTKNKKYYGLLDKYDVSEQVFKVTLLSTADTIEKDAQVVTSGLGGKNKSPKGILVGKVKDISSDNNIAGRTVSVTPAADFNDMSYVAVIERVNNE